MACASLLAGLACSSPKTEQEPSGGTPAQQVAHDEDDAPFALPADLSGVLLLWFDEAGVHSAQSLSEVPSSARKTVRVRPLDPEVESKLDPLLVYVADLSRSPNATPPPVRAMKRAEFDALVDRAAGVNAAQAGSAQGGPVVAAGGPIIVYRTSWCGVCERAVAWLQQNGHTYVEKDVEADADAAQEVQRKLAASGKSSRGVPVIDVGGKLMVGFDPNQLERLISGG